MNTSKERRSFEPDELKRLLDHLAYEWLMLEYTRFEWKVGRQRHMLEALLLHCRNLRDFLFGSIEPSDARADKALIAIDYAPNWRAEKGHQRYKVLWATRKAINAQLAHLSRDRLDPDVQQPLDKQAGQIALAVVTAWRSFSRALDDVPQWSGALDKAITAKRTELGLPHDTEGQP